MSLQMGKQNKKVTKKVLVIMSLQMGKYNKKFCLFNHNNGG
jgi:hypothetical protein